MFLARVGVYLRGTFVYSSFNLTIRELENITPSHRAGWRPPRSGWRPPRSVFNLHLLAIADVSGPATLEQSSTHSFHDRHPTFDIQPCRIASIPEGVKVLELTLGLKLPSPLTRYLAWKPQDNTASFSSYMMSREQNPEQAWSLIRNGWTFVRQDSVQEPKMTTSQCVKSRLEETLEVGSAQKH